MSQTGETNGAQIAASVPNKKLKLRRKKIIQWIVIGLLFGGAIYLIYWGITRKKDPAKYPKKVRFGSSGNNALHVLKQTFGSSVQ